MKRVHESLLSPDGLLPTLRGLGIRGVVPTGALAWQSYPAGARAAAAFPGVVEGGDGDPVGFIAPNLLSLPYTVTHLNYATRNASNARRQTWSIQDSLGVTWRQVTCQNPGKETGGVSFGQSVVARLVPIPLPPTLGVQGRLAPNIVPGIEFRAYLTALLVQPQIVPALLEVAPTASGAVIPTTAAGTTVTMAAGSWVYGSYAQLTAGLTPAVLITAVVIASLSDGDLQVAFSTGGGGSEVDWGVFGWAEPLGPGLVAARYDLQPYPLFLPPSTRVAARVRGTAGGAATAAVGFEYIPLPIR